MPWIRIDDHYDEHPKFARTGPLGVVMWLAGLAYCNRNLTDGFIPWSVARSLVSWEFLAPRPIDEDHDRDEFMWTVDVGNGLHGESVTCTMVIHLLLRAGLWDEVAGGYAIHDYGEYQPTKAQINADRAAKAAAGQAGGIAAAKARATADATASAIAKPKPKPKPVPVPNSGSDTESTPLSIARDGLPHLTPEAIEALELRTGRAVQVAGDKQLTEYDRLIEDHGLTNVCVAMDALRNGKALTARQLVWGAMKVLEPMIDTRVAADTERAEEVDRNRDRGIEATQRYLRELRSVRSGETA